MTSADSLNSYDGYEDWKGWSDQFIYTDVQADYYERQTANIPLAGSRILEVGFGSGSFLRWAKDQGALVYGTELNGRLADAAEAAGFSILPSDLRTIAGSDIEPFDAIFAFDVIEHIAFDQLPEFLALLTELLKPSGHLTLRLPNGQSPFGLGPQYGDPTHKSVLSIPIVLALLHTSSLSVVHAGAAARVARGPMWRSLLCKARYLSRDLLSRTLNFVFATKIIWDPVAVVILRQVEPASSQMD